MNDAPRLLVLAFLLALLSLAALALLPSSFAAPDGLTVISNTTEFAPTAAAGSMTTAGGSFTTLILNTTSQTMRWKAYVGNISGRFTLDDANGSTIYDWTPLTTIAGEVYASRNSSVDWSRIRCAANSTITGEQSALNMTNTMIDSINATFNESIHGAFYSGTTFFAQSSCRAIATYINDTRQATDPSAEFQEVLLDDQTNIVFAALLENAVQGFDLGRYNFQMIVPESDIAAQPHTYYFYAELS